REVKLNATVSVSILPTSKLLRTLHGYDARMSDVAKAYADFLVAERKRQIEEDKKAIAAAIRDEATSKRLQKRADETSLDATEVEAMMAQLEKLYVYDSRAVLRFRKPSINNVLSIPRTGKGLVLQVLRSGEGSTATSTLRVRDGAGIDVIRSRVSTRDSVVSSIYASRLLPPRWRTGFIDVYMVEDGGKW